LRREVQVEVKDNSRANFGTKQSRQSTTEIKSAPLSSETKRSW